MVGSSKILTVSYGTFSCTLEGFDDSFSTMKAIAEYFRDLAADDRYFGAEPATPDADMLARIAEREISRRVEARTDGSEIVLRAGTALAGPSSVAAPAAASPAADTSKEAAPVAAKNNTPLVEDGLADEATTDPEAQEPGSEGEDVSSVLLAPSEPEAAQKQTETPAAASAESPAMPPVQAPPMQRPRPAAPSSATAATDAKPRPAATLAPHPDAESVAAKLQRIRAVVGRGTAGLASLDEENAAQDDMPSDLTAHAFAEDAAGDDLDDAAISGLDLDLVGQAAVEKAEETPVANIEEEEADGSEIAASVEEEEASEDDAEEVSAHPTLTDEAAPAQEPEAVAPAADVPAPARVRVIRMRRTSTETASVAASDQDAAPVAPAVTANPAPPARQDAKAATVAEAVPASTIEAAPQEDPIMPNAAPEFVEEDEDVDIDTLEVDDIFSGSSKPLDAEEAIVSEEDLSDLARLDGVQEDTGLENLPEEDREADLVAKADFLDLPPSDLSDEAEADLMAELAALEDEDEDDDTWLAETSEAESEPDETLANDKDAREEEALFDEPSEDDAPESGAAEIDDAEFDETYEEGAWASQDDQDDQDDQDNQAEVETDAEEAPVVSSRRSLIQHADEAAMSRINAQVDAQLNEPEANRRRQAIAQLKAAVAATEAARQMGERRDRSTEVENAFRDDLQQVVRPRRPAPASEGRTERPRSAPLKLVAAQRVDRPAESAATPAGNVAPVRPRRVTAQPEAPAPAPMATREAARTAGSFEAFAKEMGANGLADLLEAAAAYTAFVEGSEDFSRPQLMNKVRAMSDDDFSREEGLRSFGTLLREGRIMKTRNGRFQVSDATRFKPERRAG